MLSRRYKFLTEVGFLPKRLCSSFALLTLLPMLFRLRQLPTRAADDFVPGHNLCSNGVQCDQYGIVPYEYVPFAQPGYWEPNPTLPSASFYDEVRLRNCIIIYQTKDGDAGQGTKLLTEWRYVVARPKKMSGIK